MLAVYCRCRIRLRQDPSWYWYHVEVSRVGTAVVNTAHFAPAHPPRSLRVFELKVRWYTQACQKQILRNNRRTPPIGLRLR